MTGRPTIDYVGKTFGKLTVIEAAPVMGGKKHWWCKCSCGRTKAVRQSNLAGGNTKSCGCLGKYRPLVFGRRTLTSK